MANGTIKSSPIRLDKNANNFVKAVEFNAKNRADGGEQNEIYFLKEGLTTGTALLISKEPDGYYLYVTDTSQNDTWATHAYIKLNTIS